MRPSLLLMALLASALGLSSARGGSLAEPQGDPTLERPTLRSLGVYWIIRGDDNGNASVALAYRKPGGEWRKGADLFRVAPGAHGLRVRPDRGQGRGQRRVAPAARPQQQRVVALPEEQRAGREEGEPQEHGHQPDGAAGERRADEGGRHGTSAVETGPLSIGRVAFHLLARAWPRNPPPRRATREGRGPR